MSSINYEEDQRKDLDSVNESAKLSDQVVKLTNLEDELANKEKELKELKRKVELVSGEIPVRGFSTEFRPNQSSWYRLWPNNSCDIILRAGCL